MLHRDPTLTSALPQSPARPLSSCLAFAGLVALFSALSPANPAQAEVRGTWLTTTGVDHIRSGNQTATTFQTLRNARLNTAYIESWKNGYTQFPSQTQQALSGWDRSPSLGPVRNLLDETVIHAHRQNMAAVAWFEYGFAAQFVGADSPNVSNPLAREAETRGWLLQDTAGLYTNRQTSFAWLNPAVPQVRQMLIDTVVEAVTQHDLDGIQFDDRLAWPTSLGYDATTRNLINQRAGFNVAVNSAFYQNQLAQLRTESLDDFVDELHLALRAVDPDLWIGLSPSVNGFSQSNYTADWPKWVAQGYFDEVAPQVYRDSINTYNTTLPDNVSPFTTTNREDAAVMGLRFNGSGSDTPLPDVLDMIEATRDAANGQLAGHSIWYSDNVVDFAGQLQAFYDTQPDNDGNTGWTPNPNLEPGHRPDPTVANAQPSNPSDWLANVTEEGAYRVIAQVNANGLWQTLESRYLRPGQQAFTTNATYLALELLPDRRPLDFDRDNDGLYSTTDANAFARAVLNQDPDADFNLDGQLNRDDLHAFAQHADTTLGDLNLDGQLDLDDALALAQSYGQNVAPRGNVGGVWSAGDLNLNGTIDFDDAMLLLHLARSAGTANAQFANIQQTLNALPEPAAALILLAGFSSLRPNRQPAHPRG